MLSSVDDCMSCPICLEVMKPPIRQCVKGHSVCGECLKDDTISNCPLCRSAMSTTRNYQLEQLIEKLANIELLTPCAFAIKGCKMKVQDMQTHEQECKFRIYNCEGKNFCNWDCKWTGIYEELAQHFKSAHEINQFKMEKTAKINLSVDSADVQAVDYHDGSALFWYKHKIDITKEKVYWLFQYVGLKKNANCYYYEFEIFDGPVRKLKITEICDAASGDGKVDFESVNCVELSFKTIKKFLNNEMLHFRYRIMNVKKESIVTATAPGVATSVKKPVASVPLPIKFSAPQPMNYPITQHSHISGAQRNSTIPPFQYNFLRSPTHYANVFTQQQLQRQQQQQWQQQQQQQAKKYQPKQKPPNKPKT